MFRSATATWQIVEIKRWRVTTNIYFLHSLANPYLNVWCFPSIGWSYYKYKHHCDSGSLDCLLPDLTLLMGVAMFKDTKSISQGNAYLSPACTRCRLPRAGFLPISAGKASIYNIKLRPPRGGDMHIPFTAPHEWYRYRLLAIVGHYTHEGHMHWSGSPAHPTIYSHGLSVTPYRESERSMVPAKYRRRH